MISNNELKAMSFNEKLKKLRSGIVIPPPEQISSIRWDFDSVAEIALRHPNIRSWLKDSKGSYMWAHRHGMLSDLTEHMELLRARPKS